MRAASTTRLTLLHPVAPTPFLQYDICQSRSVWVFATGRARLRPSTSVPGESPGGVHGCVRRDGSDGWRSPVPPGR